MSRELRNTGIRRRLHVLVIDDEPLVGRSIARMLRNHRVECMSDPTEALARLSYGEPFDAVLLDVHMPTISGVEVYATLCERLPALAARVVFMSGSRCDTEVLDALAQAEAGWVEKPFEPDALEAQLQERAMLEDDRGASAELAVG